ncbi:MAG: AmmeMemoRadiSam system protein B [Ignavibacteriaceae bacterium]
MSVFREPAVAGLFYPSGYWKLKDELQRLLQNSVSEKKFENILGLVAPHAGYVYSGKTAAFAYNLIKEKNFKNIFIISPSHREYFPGVSVYEGDGYETPLGKIPVNKEIIEHITNENKIVYKGIEGHRSEHGIEVQLPFLQFILGDGFKIIPIVMGDQSALFVDELARRLAKVVDSQSLIIASSDLSHYYTRKEADRLDTLIEKRINSFEVQDLQNDLEHNTCEACGGGPIVAMMKTAAAVNKKCSLVIHRSDSGEVSGDLNEVVGYLSAVIYGKA